MLLYQYGSLSTVVVVRVNVNVQVEGCKLLNIPLIVTEQVADFFLNCATAVAFQPKY